MTGILYASALVLLIVTALATVIYLRAVAHFHRAYLHVVLAGIFVLAAEVIAVLAVSDESTLMQGVLLAANLVGIGAMLALATRFRSQSQGQRSPGESLYAWYRARRGFVAFAAIVIITGIGFAVVQSIADDAQDAADDAADVAEDNTALICSLGELISGAPVARRPDESPVEFADRIHLLRRFARDLRELDDCDPENPVRVVVPEEDRPVLQQGRDERAEGGDATGPPSEGGGPAGGGEPPPELGVLDPIIDPIAPEADCNVTVGDVILCTEPD